MSTTALFTIALFCLFFGISFAEFPAGTALWAVGIIILILAVWKGMIGYLSPKK